MNVHACVIQIFLHYFYHYFPFVVSCKKIQIKMVLISNSEDWSDAKLASFGILTGLHKAQPKPAQIYLK